MDEQTLEKLAIREVVENWVVWRDAADWERFRTVWHSDGYMMATWFQGPAEDFIRVSREGFERGVSILHFLGGNSIELAGWRAISQTKMTISQRAKVHECACDVTCTGRFYDFFERRDGRWGIVLRQPIYEKDRMDPFGPGREIATPFQVAGEISARATAIWPTCRRDRLSDQTMDMPGLKGPEVEGFYARGSSGSPGSVVASSFRHSVPHMIGKLVAAPPFRAAALRSAGVTRRSCIISLQTAVS